MIRPVPTLIRMFAVLAALSLCTIGCQPNSENKLIDARMALQRGDTDGAALLFEEVLSGEPDNRDALIGLAEIALERGDMQGVSARLAALESLELDTRAERAANSVREGYYGQILDAARGDGPTNPANEEEYESALITLFNINGDPDLGQEIASLFLYRARATLGVSDVTQPILPDSEAIDEASIDQMRTCIAAFQGLAERDPRLNRVLPTSDDERDEARFLTMVLQQRIFTHEFQLHFDSTLRSAVVEEGLYDPANNVFLFAYDAPFGIEIPEDEEELAALQLQFRVELAAEGLTDLAYRVRSLERPMESRAVYLGRRGQIAETYRGVALTEWTSRRGNLTANITVPYELFQNTTAKFDRLRERLQAEGSGLGVPTAEGSGAAGEGSGDLAAEATGSGEGADDGADDGPSE